MKATIGATAVAAALAFPGGAWAAHPRVTVTVAVQTTTVQTTTVRSTSEAATSPTSGPGIATTSTGTIPTTTVVQTTTVPVSPPAKPRPTTKCLPGSVNRNLCETLPPHPTVKPRKAKPPPSPPKPRAVTPTPPVIAGQALPPLTTTLSRLAAKAVNSLIDLFPVPPFLLPIYQEAGDVYDVPWPVLAAINEIETDFGRNLSVSSAGAIGWMQFMPSTWMKYGLDADGRGTANPYDPIDAIFAAARYLHAAGSSRNLTRAIFAYNHAGWYVNSVVLRATLLRYLPQNLVDALVGLMQASFPVAGHLGRYAGQAPERVRVGRDPGVAISAPVGSPVIAVADGRVVALGQDGHRGRFVTIQDSYGNRFKYWGLGSVEKVYPVIKPRRESAAEVAGDALLALAEKHGGVAPGAAQPVGASGGSAPAPKSAAAQSTTVDGSGGTQAAAPAGLVLPQPPPMAKERLFADPLRPASYAAGGRIQLQSSVSSYALATWLQVGGRGPADYFSEPLRLRPRQFALAALRPGATVIAGTILGRVARTTHGSPGVVFQVRPAGAARPVDPTSIIAGWELLGRLTAGRSAIIGAGEAGAYGIRNSSLGQLLLASKSGLERTVLTDRRVTVGACGRQDIERGDVDRRVLAAIEYLSYSGLAPDVSGLVCGQPAAGSQPITQLQITRLGGLPVVGHQRIGGVVDKAIRALLQLQGALRPAQIISLRSYPWQSATVALADHTDRLEVDFSSTSPGGTGAAGGPLDPTQWRRLIRRLDQLAGQPGEPTPFAAAPGSAR